MNTDKLRFSFVIPNKLAGMSWPEKVKPVADAVSYLKKQGITTLVNTSTASYANTIFSGEFDLIHEPMANMTAPTVNQMDNIIEAYSKLTELEAMAVHCMHGIGRTGTVIACILGKTYNIKTEESIRSIIGALRQKRQGSIESDEQEQFIYRYLGRSRLCDCG